MLGVGRGWQSVIVVQQDFSHSLSVVDSQCFHGMEEVGWAEYVIDAARTRGSPSCKVEFGGVMEGGSRDISKICEVGEDAVCEFSAFDVGIGVGVCVGFDRA